MVQIRDVIGYVRGRAPSWELFSKKSSAFTAETSGEGVDFVSSGESWGLGVRVGIGKKTGFAYTDNIAKYRDCIDEAVRICKAADDSFQGFPERQQYAKGVPVRKDMKGFTVEDASDFFEGFFSVLKEGSKDIEAGSGNFKHALIEKRIVNSEGIDCTESRSYNLVDFDSLKLRSREGIISLPVGLIENRPIDPDVAREFAERLTMLAGKERVDTAVLPVIFHPDCMGDMIHGYVNSNASGESLLQDRTAWKGLLGKKIADGSLSITDDGSTPGLFRTRRCDDEGVRTQVTPIIRKGVLKNFIYDSYNAGRAGRKSTGNAHRSEFSPPEISTNNLVIAPGRKDGLIRGIDRGLYIRDVMGIHTMNMNTGDFSLAVSEGHYIENGEIRHPVKDTMLSGNLGDLLRDAITIGKKVTHIYNNGLGGVYCPEMLFPEVNVIGKK